MHATATTPRLAILYTALLFMLGTTAHAQTYDYRQGGFGRDLNTPNGNYNRNNYTRGQVTPAIPSHSNVNRVTPRFQSYSNQIQTQNRTSNSVYSRQPQGVRYQDTTLGPNSGYFDENPNQNGYGRSRAEYNRQIGRQRIKEVNDCFEARKGQDNRGKEPCKPTTQWSYPTGTFPRGYLLNQTASQNSTLPRGSLLNRSK